MIELEECICNAYPNFRVPYSEVINEWSILNSKFTRFDLANGFGSGFYYAYYYGYPVKDYDDMVTNIMSYGKGNGSSIL